MRCFGTEPTRGKAALAAWKTFAASLCAATLAALSSLAQPAQAAGISTLYSFCELNGCQDGAAPGGGLVADAQGNLFGTTQSGGNINSAGVIYEVVRHPKRGTARYRSLYEFCALPACADGRYPLGRLVIDGAGRLYGTTWSGGDVNSGVAFMLSPRSAGHSKWSYAVLQSFCSGQPTCVAGAVPLSGFTYAGAYAGAPYDGTSPLYGVASRGGKYGNGTVYSLRHHQLDWKFRALYAFCPDLGTCAGGSAPQLAVLDGADNLYGIANGGNQNAGLVFKLTPGSGNAYSESVLHDFCSSPNCADGKFPSDLIVDAGGNLFGTARQGGVTSHLYCGGCGTLFKIASDDTFSVLHAFCARTPRCTDGFAPSGITLTPSGDIYGVTFYGGKTNAGTLFRMAATMHTLFSFCPNGCSAGANPVAAPLQDGAGKLFGVAAGGGESSHGTVYEFTR